MVQRRFKREESDGETQVRAILRKLKLKFQSEKVINGLKGDNKSFRRADFYLPEYDVYIEWLGGWESVNSVRREEERERYREKKKVYDDNKIKCIWLFPSQTNYLSKAITDKLEMMGFEYPPKKEPKTKQTPFPKSKPQQTPLPRPQPKPITKSNEYDEPSPNPIKIPTIIKPNYVREFLFFIQSLFEEIFKKIGLIIKKFYGLIITSILVIWYFNLNDYYKPRAIWINELPEVIDPSKSIILTIIVIILFYIIWLLIKKNIKDNILRKNAR